MIWMSKRAARFGGFALLVWGLAGDLSAQGEPVARDVVYREVDGKALHLDIYRPEGEGPFPVALVIHGGGWRGGSRNGWTARSLVSVLLREGIACATVEYRLVPKVRHPSPVDDCACAIQFLRARGAEWRLDPTWVAAAGISAGGHLAAMVAVEKDRVRADDPDLVKRQRSRPDFVLSVSAPMDLADESSSVSALSRSLAMAYLGVQTVDDDALKLGRSASPAHRVQAGMPPMLLISGNADPLVPIDQSRRMLKALQGAGVSAKSVEVNGGHGDYLVKLARVKGDEAPPPYWRDAQGFLRQHVPKAPGSVPAKGSLLPAPAPVIDSPRSGDSVRGATLWNIVDS